MHSLQNKAAGDQVQYFSRKKAESKQTDIHKECDSENRQGVEKHLFIHSIYRICKNHDRQCQFDHKSGNDFHIFPVQHMCPDQNDACQNVDDKHSDLIKKNI